MFKRRVYLVFIAGLILTLFGVAIARAQSENVRDPLLKEGQLFTVKLVPAGKALEISIAGKKIADLKVSELGLSASMKVGNRILSVEPKLKAGRYLIESPEKEEPSELKLKIQHGKQEEQFEFDLNVLRP